MHRLDKFGSVAGVTHCFSTVADGNMSFNWGGEMEVTRNKREFLEEAGIPLEKCVQMEVLDDAVVKEIGRSWRGKTLTRSRTVKADALTTDKKNIFLFLVVADCLPVLFYDRRNAVVGLAHLGWKSTETKLCPEVLRFMRERYATHPRDVLVGIGPGIHKESYLFEKPLKRRLGSGWEDYLIDSSVGLVAIDLVGYNKKQLLDSGVPEENIEISDVDTAASRDFFSHCRSRKTGEGEGRFAAVVGMR